MTVGPLSIGWSQKSGRPLQEGSFTELACIPKLRSVVSINGSGLDQPIKVMMPNDLEARGAAAPPAVTAGPMTVSTPQTDVPAHASDVDIPVRDWRSAPTAETSSRDELPGFLFPVHTRIRYGYGPAQFQTQEIPISIPSGRRLDLGHSFDTGGTFTDAAIVDPDSFRLTAKASRRPP